MNDIVELLRSIAEPIDGSDLWVIREAADEIERLRKNQIAKAHEDDNDNLGDEEMSR